MLTINQAADQLIQALEADEARETLSAVLTWSVGAAVRAFDPAAPSAKAELERLHIWYALLSLFDAVSAAALAVPQGAPRALTHELDVACARPAPPPSGLRAGRVDGPSSPEPREESL